MAFRYNSNRSDCRTISAEVTTPTAARSAIWRSSNSGDAVTRSRSSIRMMNSRSVVWASNAATRAVRRLPMWRSPVGEGAKRPAIAPFLSYGPFAISDRSPWRSATEPTRTDVDDSGTRWQRLCVVSSHLRQPPRCTDHGTSRASN